MLNSGSRNPRSCHLLYAHIDPQVVFVIIGVEFLKKYMNIGITFFPFTKKQQVQHR